MKELAAVVRAFATDRSVASQLDAQILLDAAWLATVVAEELYRDAAAADSIPPQHGDEQAQDANQSALADLFPLSGPVDSWPPTISDEVSAAEPDPVGSQQVAMFLARTDWTGTTDRRTVSSARVQGPPPLSDALLLARALRPLRRSRKPGRRTVLDVEETVRATVEAGGRLQPIMQYVDEPRFTAHLVIDDSPSMNVWSDALRSFADVLRRANLFSSVRVWQLSERSQMYTTPLGRPGVHLLSAPQDWAGPDDVFIVATDVFDERWRSPEMWSLVWSIGLRSSIALLNPLPPDWWARSALPPDSVRVRAQPPVSSNQALSAPLPRRRSGRPARAVLPLPVLDLSPAGILAWSSTIANADPSGCLGVLMERGMAEGRPPRPASGAEAVRGFWRLASPQARRLAVLLSASEVHSYATMRTVQSDLLPSSSVADLAQVLAGGLLTSAPSADTHIFSFNAEARAELHSQLTAADAFQVHRSLVASVGRTLSGNSFRVLFDDPEGLEEVPMELAVLARAADSALKSAGYRSTRNDERAPSSESPFADFKVEKTFDEYGPAVTISWAWSRRGRVTIYVHANEADPGLVPGRTFTREEFVKEGPTLGTLIQGSQSSDGMFKRIGPVLLDPGGRGERSSRWTVTAVIELGATFTVACRQFVVHVGDVVELHLDERVDWQLLASSWPPGATFLGLWQVPPGETPTGAPDRRITRDEFDVHGGLALQLGPHPVDLLVRGAAIYGGNWTYGGVRRVSYPGRWVVRYELPLTGRSGGTRRLQLMVERPDWPNLSFALIADQTGFPLRSNAPTVSTVVEGQLPGSALAPGQFALAIPELKTPKGSTTRLIAGSSAGVPTIVLDPLDPPADRPPVPPPPGLHCPRCLRISDLSTQHFRCQGDCERVADVPLTQLLQPGTTDPSRNVINSPVFEVVRAMHKVRNTQVMEPPVNSATCPDCRQDSYQHVCPHCHTSLPPNWWVNDVLGVAIVGTRASGKTVYLTALIRHLERNLLPRMNGYLHPCDEQTGRRLTHLMDQLDSGRLGGGSMTVASDESILRPMILSLGPGVGGRERTLSLFETAGEDMARQETLRPYIPALTGADLIVLLIDPLQLNGVREWLYGTLQLPPVGEPAVNVLRNIVREIRSYRDIATGPLPQRVAVAFTKLDGLQEAAALSESPLGGLIGPGNALWRDPYPLSAAVYHQPDGRRVNEEVRALLLEMGESALVSRVESSFREVQYFAFSALGHGPRGDRMHTTGASPQRVGDPLRWLMWLAGWG